MRESVFYLGEAGERIFAVLHEPTTPSGRGVVLCAPLAEEMLWSRRVFVTLARELAAKGYSVLRFDYRGEGDSERHFESSTLETRMEDLAFVVDSLRRLVPGIQDLTLIGLRLGATIAAAVAASRPGVHRLVLWDPVLDGADYMQGVLRANLMFQMAQHRKVIENRDQLVGRMRSGETVNVEGYEFATGLFDQVSSLRLGEVLPVFEGHSLIITISPREAPPRPEHVHIAASCRAASAIAVTEEPFWREIKTFYQRADQLFDTTLDWMAQST